MKRLKCFIMILASLLQMVHPITACSSESIATITEVILDAAVPTEFDGKITVIFTEQETKKQIPCILDMDNKYSGKINLTSRTYDIEASIKGDYQTDIPEKYKVEGEQVSISFNVKKESLAVANNKDKFPHREDMHEEDVKEGQKIVANFMEQAVLVINKESYQSFFKTYVGEVFLKSYLKADPLNTEEQWKSMEDFEKFFYYIILTMPYSKLMSNEYLSETEFTGELIAQKKILSGMDNGYEFYKSIEDVWLWHYKYWQHTGTFYKFFDYYTETESNRIISEKLNASNQEAEMENIPEREVRQNIIIRTFKEYSITTTVLILAGAGMLIMQIKKYRSKKNGK